MESKRYEPFRDKKTANLSTAYDRDVWGDAMGPFMQMRDRLRAEPMRFIHLDAAQLTKHAFGLVTEGRRLQKAPILMYLYAEPERRGDKLISPMAIARHRAEIVDFADAVAGAEVAFAACSWRDWLDSWSGDTRAHATAIIAAYQP